jgi:DNA-binding NtrC family response regulator
MAAMRGYSWPGNVRELRNAIELLCVLREGKPAKVSDLPAAIQQAMPTTLASQPERGAPGAVLEVRLDQPLEETIERVLRAALEAEGGNRSRAARRLGISLRTMQRHAARFGRPARDE